MKAKKKCEEFQPQSNLKRSKISRFGLMRDTYINIVQNGFQVFTRISLNSIEFKRKKKTKYK